MLGFDASNSSMHWVMLQPDLVARSLSFSCWR